jgi:hypothetical protein
MAETERGQLRAAADLLERGGADGRLLLSRDTDPAEVAAWLRSEAASSLPPDIHAVELARLILAKAELYVRTNTEDFPPGCNCERIDVGTNADLPSTQFVRGRSDPPCRIHLRAERVLWDDGYRRGYTDGRKDYGG